MIKISFVWLVLVITAQGPQAVSVPEEKKFDSKEACAEWGKSMTPRMEDFARGMMGADWGVEMFVRFHCDADGIPA